MQLLISQVRMEIKEQHNKIQKFLKANELRANAVDMEQVLKCLAPKIQTEKADREKLLRCERLLRESREVLLHL